jgi:hypothetical protein
MRSEARPIRREGGAIGLWGIAERLAVAAIRLQGQACEPEAGAIAPPAPANRPEGLTIDS